MKSSDATECSQITGKFADNLPCNATDFDSLLDKKAIARSTMCKLPSNSLHVDDHKGSWSSSMLERADSDPSHLHPVLMNVMQKGFVKSKCTAPLAMERRRRCSCELSMGFSSSICNCNMENCNWVPEEISNEKASKSLSWRSSSDQTNTNAALVRALAAMKKVSGEPDAIKKAQRTGHMRAPDGHMRAPDSFSALPYDGEVNPRSITSSDARTLSMRERGRWGNSKMQQQISAASMGGQHHVKPNLSSDHNQHHQALQHVQCLHCGSFSTTPVGGNAAAKAPRSHSFGRRVRDYSWQQELLQEQKKPEQQPKELNLGGAPVPRQRAGPQDSAAAAAHHHCEYARCPDFFPDYGPGMASHLPIKLQHTATMSWQDRYMLLCQAIAAGAFLDSAHDSTDDSGPLPPARGYSWAVCECAGCEAGGEISNFRRSVPNFSTSSGERMMELEAFSGPLGYVSESKGASAMAELSSIMEKRPPKRGVARWWARLPSFGKAKSSATVAPPPPPPVTSKRAAGQATVQCKSCGQRVWTGTRKEVEEKEEEEEEGRLCPECMGRAGGAPPARNGQGRAVPPSSAHQGQSNFKFAPQHHQRKHSYPPRWRLMKLCRYLMGFPLQR